MADDGRGITKEEAKTELKKLIEFYNRNKDIYGKSSEQNIRQKLIDELFLILGWDLRGKESADEVTMEESISNEASKKKKSDYVFRLYGVPKFVVEAKAVKVDINSDEFREQAIGYSYNLACSWAVLTNFVQTRVYFVDKNDDTSIIRIEDLSDLSKFDETFEQLWLLSKEAAKNSLLEERIKGMGIRQEKEKVFKQLFIDLKDWRGKLSNEIRRKYSDYQDYEIEEIVQRIIDRLIFIRKMEDLEIEERKLDQVARKINEGDGYVTYRQLKKVFEYYMEKYNSGLFGEEGKEQACDDIDIQDNVIKSVIQGMYTPTGRRVEYNFAAISGDVLGNIYEEYLSYILKLKENQKKTKLEGGRAHKKEQGIYYTPTYIVDYIVKNSVGEYIRNKSIDEILDTKILDPACGSGSFLIRAFSEVCKTVEAKMKKGEKASKSVALKTYDKRLALPQKTTILLSCIYGVDLDKKAVEIAQLNLFLKLLEGETAETISKLKNTKKILPMLNNNVLVGNSLIEDKELAGEEKAFNWSERFPEIMKREFDIVIGNPPYVRIQTLNKKEVDFFNTKYKGAGKGNYDIYVLFIEQALNLLEEGGCIGFIVPNKFFTAIYGEPLRKLISEGKYLHEIVHFGDQQVFENATTYTCLLFLGKQENKKFKFTKVDNLENWKKTRHAENGTVSTTAVTSAEWNFAIGHKAELFERLSKMPIKLSDVTERIYQGPITSADTVYLFKEFKSGKSKSLIDVFSKEQNDWVTLESDILKHVVRSGDIGRYWAKPTAFVLFPYEVKKNSARLFTPDEMQKNYPLAWDYLNRHKKLLEDREHGHFKDVQWYRFGRTQNLGMWEQPKLMIPYMITELSAYPDLNENLYFINVTTGGYGITNNAEKCNDVYLCGLLNSKLLNFYFKQTSTNFHGGYFAASKQYIEQIPIRTINFSDSKDKLMHDKIIKLINSILSLNKRLSDLGDKKTDERARIEEEIKKTDEEIDELVYKIYGITEGEKRVIEGSLK